ncbi:acetate--CoA ligase family protein [Pseudonocardia sp. TRM90224]|uniref:acetate--CoA ligase family protein n=1 Tax=Pseudonocardia sp. TRM90224 TaxID=2812678 RepID=UPI001E32A019|nr:acetate--CoA ligase family protein [Pseudonocardia sp. TRM90224]
MTDGLRVFFDPRSVAVVGASGDPSKWGYWLARGALRGSDRRRVHLVNHRRAVIEGTSSAASLRDLPEVPELVVLSTPAETVPAVVDEALELGVPGFLGITAGIEGEADLATRIRAAGSRIIGPNCLGLFDATTTLELAWGTFAPGCLGVVSQSGQLGLELAGLAARAGLGVSRFVSVGNQIDVTATEALEDLVGHAATKAVVVYLEGFADGRGFVATLDRLREAGKPVIVLTVGASEASRAAARSHTGALTATAAVVDAACRAAGAILVETPAQAIDLAHLLVGNPLPQGRRVAVVSDSGGHGAIAADVLARNGLTVPRLSEAIASDLRNQLPSGAAVANPIDLAGAGEQDLGTYARVVEQLLQSSEVDAVLLSGYFGSYGADTPALVERELEVVKSLAGAQRETGRPIVVHSMCTDSLAVDSMRALAVPTLHTIDAAARSLGLAAELSDRGRTGRPPQQPEHATITGTPPSGYLGALDLLASEDIVFCSVHVVENVDQVVAAAHLLTAPYALKAGWIDHKSDVGGVVLDLPDADTAAAAFTEMEDRLGPGAYVLEEMDTRPGVVELIVGGHMDPSFGPVVLVGLGGVTAELYRDTQTALAPVSIVEAHGMLRRLHGHVLLEGWRGRPAADIDAAARAVVAVSRIIAEYPHIQECEINPLRVAPDGAIAVDALVVGQWS